MYVIGVKSKMIRISNLQIRSREDIFVNLDYCFDVGKIYGLVATNGSGKTTFFRALTKLYPVHTGKLIFPITNFNDYTYFYFETSDWFDGNLTALDYLMLVKNQWNSDVAISSVIDLLNMKSYYKEKIKTYSLGMKQRLLISLYVLSDAKIWFMDEITNGLDEQSRIHLFDIIKIAKSKDKLIIISSHYKEDLIDTCDFLLTILEGKLVVI